MSYSKIFLFLAISWIIVACEKEITVNLPAPKDQLVVEGYIENDVPPYIFLTKNSAYFGNFNVNDLGKYFVNGAKMVITTEDDSVELVEYSSNTVNFLPEEEKTKLSNMFGIPLDTNSNFPENISVYTIPLDDDFVGKIGHTYDLRIEAEGKVLTATTTIPQPVGFEEIWVIPHPNPDYDTLVQVRGKMKDPDTLGNFYRYFTKRNSTPYSLNNQSVFEDLIYNGKEFSIDIPYGWDRFSEEDFNINTFGYWHKGDTCYVKLCSIDKAHYDFWRTLENELSNQGSPFGSFTRIKTNIHGGIGIWGGYASTLSVYYPEE